MKYYKIEGLIVSPFTPFDKKSEVDLSPTSDCVAKLQKNNWIGLFISDSSSDGLLFKC